MEKYLINGLLVVLFFITLAWREVQILIDRGSWKAENYKKLYWYINWKSFWKNFDSFHVANGVAVLIVSELFVINDVLPVFFRGKFSGLNVLIEQAHVAAYWLIGMQIRNLFMHKVLKKGK